MKITKRWMRGLCVAVTAVMIGSLLACGGSGSTTEDGITKITASSLTDDTAMPLWLADELGYFEDNKLEVEIQYAASGAAALPAGVAGDWQAGWIGAPPAMSGWEKWELISFPHIKEGDNLKLLMRNDALKGSSPADVLETKKVGTGANSTFQYMLFECARQFDVDVKDLTVVPLDPPQVRQALAAGEIAAGTSSAAGDYELLNDTENYTKVCDGTMSGASFISNYMVTPAFWKDDPDAAARFVDAVYRANEYVAEHPDQAMTYMMEFDKSVGLDTNKKRAQYTLESRHWVGLDEAIQDMSDGTTAETLNGLSDFFVEVGVYEEKPDVGALTEEGLTVLEAAQEYRQSTSGRQE